VIRACRADVEDLTRDELAAADSAFLTTSGRGIVEVQEVDGQRYRSHPLTSDLAARWATLP
jgi:branched-subunit amino acid aminotransferase/4-amino-4-deoxychorismate lyase